MALLFLLLLLPGLAFVRLSILNDWRFTCAGLAVVSTATWMSYRGDKARAREGAWRTPERIMHTLELLGGWPVAFLARRVMEAI